MAQHDSNWPLSTSAVSLNVAVNQSRSVPSASVSSHVRHAVILLNETWGGGVAKAMLSLGRAFQRRGWKSTIVSLERDGPDVGLPVEYLNVVRARSALRPARRALRRLAPDVLITAGPQINLLGVLAAAGIAPIVVTEHSMLHWLLRIAPSPKLTVTDRARALLYRRAKAIVAVSNAVALELRQIGLSRVTIIRNPILNADLHASANAVPSHPWLATKMTPVVVALGHLIMPKGFDVLIRAFKHVALQSDARLVIFGDGPLREELERLVTELDLTESVDLPGVVANPHAEIAAADVLASASFVEAAPLAVSEALCLGVPIVAAKAEGGMAEILGNGRFGDLVPVRDEAALAASILRTLRRSRPTPVTDEAVSAFRESSVVAQWERLLGW
jgi:glycosyltransferase involved in cell wall biosynthesis